MPLQSGTAQPGISSAFLAANQTGVGSDAYGGTLVEAVQAGAGIEAILLAGIVAGLFHSLATVHSQPRRDSPLLLVERARFVFIILLVVATFIAAGMHAKGGHNPITAWSMAGACLRCGSVSLAGALDVIEIQGSFPEDTMMRLWWFLFAMARFLVVGLLAAIVVQQKRAHAIFLVGCIEAFLATAIVVLYSSSVHHSTRRVSNVLLSVSLPDVGASSALPASSNAGSSAKQGSTVQRES